MLIYVFIKPCLAKAGFDGAILAENSAEELVKYSAPLERAFLDLRDWSVLSGGKTLSSFGEQICLELPTDKITEVSAFMKKFEYTTKCIFAVGIGLNPLEAYKAMISSEDQCGEKIVLYSEDLETERMEKAELIKMDYNVEFPGLGLDKEEPEQAQPQKVNDNSGDSSKKKLIQTLMLVRAKAPIIAQLKQIDPKAYAAVKQLVDALIMLSQGK